MKSYDYPLFRLLGLAASVLFLCFPVHGNPPVLVDSGSEFLFAKGQHTVSIPFEISDKGHIFLSTRVNGSEILWFGLDSGS